MKLFLVLLILLFSAHAQARELGNVCSIDCSTPMLEIWDSFNNSEYYSEELPAVFSGGCFFKSRLYNPTHKHWGGILVDKLNQNDNMFGSFNFFGKEDPYQNLNVSTAREKFKAIASSKSIITIENDYGFVDMNTGNTPLWMYWLKHDVQTGDLILIGAWGVDTTLFCRLKKH